MQCYYYTVHVTCVRYTMQYDAVLLHCAEVLLYIYTTLCSLHEMRSRMLSCTWSIVVISWKTITTLAHCVPCIGRDSLSFGVSFRHSLHMLTSSYVQSCGIIALQHCIRGIIDYLSCSGDHLVVILYDRTTVREDKFTAYTWYDQSSILYNTSVGILLKILLLLLLLLYYYW